jgi:hypothetical protein
MVYPTMRFLIRFNSARIVSFYNDVWLLRGCRRIPSNTSDGFDCDWYPETTIRNRPPRTF